jgi:hypothetical protein
MNPYTLAAFEEELALIKKAGFMRDLGTSAMKAVKAAPAAIKNGVKAAPGAAANTYRGSMNAVGDVYKNWANPVASAKAGAGVWAKGMAAPFRAGNNMSGGNRALSIAGNLMEAHSIYTGARDAISKNDPTGQNRGRGERVGALVGDRVGSFIGHGAGRGTIPGLVAGMVSSGIGRRVGSTVGKGADLVAGRRRPAPPQGEGA